jgi:hypothetical protein
MVEKREWNGWRRMTPLYGGVYLNVRILSEHTIVYKRQSARLLICRGSLDVIDDEHLHRTLGCFEFQTELLLHRG